MATTSSVKPIPKVPVVARPTVARGSLLEGLTPAQARAVTHTGGPLLIVAGAGTGKTKVITHRLAWLMTEGGLAGREVLAVTFSNKAAEELERRLDELLPFGFEPPAVGTFHAFGERVLRENALAIGLSPDFKVLSPADQHVLVRQHVDDLELDFYRPLGNPAKFVGALVQHFSRAKDEAVQARDYVAWAQTQVAAAEARDLGDVERDAVVEEARCLLEVARAFAHYEKLLAESGNLDVADLITKTLTLLRKRPSVLARYRAQLKAILVDEFQDTNFAQYQLIQLLATGGSAAKPASLTVVADDDQAIYRWRGASVANVRLFTKDHPDATAVSLRVNFRSTQAILDAAYSVIRKNDPERLEVALGIDKKLLAARGAGPAPLHYRAATREQEVAYVVRRVGELHGTGHAWSDLAILVRSNAGAEPFVAGLAAAGVPFQFVAVRGLYARPEVLDLLAWLRVVVDPRDSVSLHRVLSGEEFRLPPLDLVTLEHLASKETATLYDVLVRAAAKDADVAISDDGRAVADKLLDTLRTHIELAQRKAVGQVLFRYVEDTKLLQRLTQTDNAEDAERVLNINTFFKRVLQFEQNSEDKSTRAFLKFFELMQQAGENPAPADVESTPDAVRITTVHAAKGLEWPVVFLVDCVEQRFPAVARREPIELPPALVAAENRAELPGAGGTSGAPLDDRAAHLAEERRLFYVACTRARDELVVTSSADSGGVRKHKPSRFITEAAITTVEAPEVSLPQRLAAAKAAQAAAASRTTRAATAVLKPPSRFSYTQLVAFETCPLQYKFAHLYKIPSLGSAAFSYGKSLHAALAAFHAEIKPGQPAPTQDRLLQLLEEHWINEWYTSHKHEQDRKAAARTALERYYRGHTTNGATLKPSLWIEQDFTLKLGPYRLIGRMDRADELPDGTLEIIDYKTGSLKEPDKLKKSDQLAIYALAARQVYGKTASKLTWYYLDEGTTITTERTPAQLAELESTLQEKIAAIVASDYAPTPSFSCKFCDFRKICEAGQASGFV
ncbi:MAG: UvrD-helicase domain-containing protein [Candidatus Andersenbacteria bacterium]